MYNTAYSQPQSTTGNVYGIYDAAAGTHEYVMAINDIGNPNNNDESGFITYPDEKYYDNYTDINDILLGSAIYETKKWYQDFVGFQNEDNLWLERGDKYPHGSSSGVFELRGEEGFASVYYSTRPVIPQFK